MSTDRYSTITRILREALALRPGERPAYLTRACAGDAALRAAVEDQLDRQDTATIPGGPASADTATRTRQSDPAPAPHPPHARTIGRYTVLELLGEGGMGVVYLAEQDRPKRTVALKVIRPGLLTPRLLRRFELESQVLGRLQHPGIAQIYDAGTADGGSGPQPFFAMEHVKGLALGEYARAAALDLRARLALFVRVCEAVHHAHQKGVIHRDLKPGNILVNAEGQPKVLDFGVARATDADIQTATMQTDVGQLLGTLPYMSPEQVAGNTTDLDIRSDVYSLGVVLYELLSGRLPHPVSNKTIPEAARIIGTEEPTPLSVADRTLKGDLQTIVAKALEKDRERRYQSASDLAADIGRYLRNETISARPPSTGYQLRKFAARNRALVGGVVAAFLLLALGVAGTAWQTARATAGRTRAQAAEARAKDDAEIAREINDFLTSMLGAINPEEAQGEEPTLRELIDRAALGVGERFRGRPVVELSVRETLGNTYQSLARFEDAEKQYAAMVGLCTREYGADDRQTLNARRNLAGIWTEMGRYGEAEPAAKEILASFERLFGQGDFDAAMAGMELGRIYQETGRMAEAEPYLRRAVEVGKATRGTTDKQVITSIHNLGTSLKDFGKVDEGVPLLREALRLRLATFGPSHPDTLFTKNSLAAALHRSPAPDARDEAETLIRETLAERTRVLGPTHTGTITTMANLAVMLVETKQFDEALPLAEAAYAGWTAKLGEEHPKTLIAQANLGYLYEDLGRLEEAERFYRRAVELRKKSSGGRDPETWSPMNNLAMLLQKRGDLAEAESTYRELLALCESTLPPGHVYAAIFRNNFGECLTLAGKFDEAASSLTTSLATLEAQLGADHARTKKALARLAALREAKTKN